MRILVDISAEISFVVETDDPKVAQDKAMEAFRKVLSTEATVPSEVDYLFDEGEIIKDVTDEDANRARPWNLPWRLEGQETGGGA